MYVKILSSATLGIDAYVMEVEFDIAPGMPAWNLVGLPDTSIKESRDRVQSALTNNGFPFPLKKITINFAPADIQKEGPALDLPIAIGMLCGSGLIAMESVERAVFLGELALDGSVRPVRGVLPIAVKARHAEMGSGTPGADHCSDWPAW